MYCATALFQDAEIGFGESENYDDAVCECVESIPRDYLFVRDDVRISIVRDGNGVTVSMPLSLAEEIAHDQYIESLRA